jgi:hypothetical protein
MCMRVLIKNRAQSDRSNQFRLNEKILRASNKFGKHSVPANSEKPLCLAPTLALERLLSGGVPFGPAESKEGRTFKDDVG